jgi:hypothetical protein
MIVKTGIKNVINQIKDGSVDPPTHIGVGTGTTAENENNTVLITEVYPTTSRNAPEVNKSDDVVFYKMSQSTSEGSTATYAEHGLFSNSTTGTMFSRQTHPDIDKDSDTVMESLIAVEVSSYLP